MKKTQLARILRERGISIKELADAVGLSVRTIHNISCGNSKSLIARRKISNFLGAKIWPYVEVTERVLTLPLGTEFEYPKAEQARDAFDELTCELTPGAVTRRGRVVIFNRPLVIAIEIEKPKCSQSAKPKISGGSTRVH